MPDLYDEATGESLDPDGDGSGGPCSLDMWTTHIGQEPPPPRYPTSAWRVAELRAMPYADYLQTPTWKLTRHHVLYRARGKCEHCGTRTGPLHVHHLTYERLGNERLTDLQALCAKCHERVHADAA